MQNPLEENKSGLYRFLVSTQFKHSDVEKVGHNVSKALGVDLLGEDVTKVSSAHEFEEMGMPQWLGVDLCHFYLAFTEPSNFALQRSHRSEQLTHESVVDEFNQFIYKISRSIYVRERSWTNIEKGIKLFFLNAVQDSVVAGDLDCDDDQTVIQILDQAQKVVKKEQGYNGALLDILSHLLIGLDNPDPAHKITTNPDVMGRQHTDTLLVNELILWSIFWDFKAAFAKKLPEDLFMPIPAAFLLNPSLQQLYIEKIREPIE